MIAGIDALQLVEAGEQQAGADQQHDGDGHLRDDEHSLQPPASDALAGPLAALLHRIGQIDTRRERRQRAERQAGEHRHCDREEQHARVNRHLAGPRREARDEGREHAGRPSREEQAERAAGEREHGALGQQLADQPAASGAERRPHRQLAVAAQEPRQRQVGDVRAGDEEHETGRAKEEQQHRPRVLRHLAAHVERGRGESSARSIRGLVLARETVAQHFEVGGRALARHTRLQLAEHIEDREDPRVLVDARLRRGAERTRRARHVDVALLRIVRHIRQDADHRVRPIVHLEHLPDDRLIAAELLLPVAVAQDQHRRRARRVIVGDKRSAEDRLDSGHAVGGKQHPVVAAEEIEVHLVELDQAVEVRGRLIAVGEVLLDRSADVGAADERRRLANDDQPIAVGIR